MIGTRLAHYDITAVLGKGGMGEVYRATDTKLGREVALKILPPVFSSDPERRARFEREARTLASFQHPNIASIYGFEEAEGQHFLIMELAEGEDLSERLARGPVTVDTSMKIAHQIAEGLEAAHESGIVHRDLKPANVIIGVDGEVKLLDFGLARAIEGEGPAAVPDNSPTLTAAFTAPGVILGTAAYMSPEQARGKPVDKRSDIWAFGVILWEMLTGERLFGGETVSDILAAVLTREADLDALPRGVPFPVRNLLTRCLQRDPKLRLRDIGEARLLLADPSSSMTMLGPIDLTEGADKVIVTRLNLAALLPWALLAVVVAWLGWKSMDREVAVPPHTARFELTLPQEMWVASGRQMVAVSPSGDTYVMSLTTGSETQLYLRALDHPDLVPVPETKGASTPFFSPDGQWIAFTQDGKLRKVPRDGGAAVDLCTTRWGGGVWLSDGRIIITDSYSSGLFIVPAGGGQKETLTEPDRDQGELGHWWPQLLPGDEWVIYTSWQAPLEKARIMALSLKNGERKVLAEGGVFGRWAPSGHLLFVRGGKMMAATFDLDKLEVTGVPESVVDDVYLNPYDGFTNLSFGQDGTLIYVPASVMEPATQLAWVDREGAMTLLDVPQRRYWTPRISPDGKRIAVPVVQDRNPDVWLHDLARGTWSRFTYSSTTDFNPHWTPDSRTVIYNHEEPQFTIYQRPADGSTDTQLLLKEATDAGPTSISPDGSLLVFNRDEPGKFSDIVILQLDGSGETRPFLSTRFNEQNGVISPDGNWLAYISNESGDNQIYAMAFPDGGSRVQVSIDGGEEPIWSPQGDEILFLDRAGIMTAAVDQDKTTKSNLAVGRPRQLMTDPFGPTNPNREFSISPDGQRFLTAHQPLEAMPRTLHVVVNWFTELETVAAAGR